MKIKFLAGGIITVAVILAIVSVWGDSFVVDEIPHVGSGYSYLAKGDYRLNPEHPPLAKSLAAIPLLFFNLRQEAFQTKPWQDDVNGQWEFGRNLIFETGNNADLMTHAAKMPMLLFFILGAVLVFSWARKLYGPAGALVSLVIFSFSPTILAHSRFVTTDAAALFGVLSATYFFLRYLKNKTAKNFLIAGVIFGIALLTKFSTFLLVPFLAFLALVYGWVNKDKFSDGIRHVLLAIAVFVVGFVLIVWPAYYVLTRNYPAQRQHYDTREILKTFGNRYLADPVVWLSDKPVLRAAGHYGLGLLMVLQRSVGGNTTYFLGEVSRFGWHNYFPIVYFIKEPLAWWALAIVALLTLGWQLRAPSKKSLSRGYEFVKNHFDEFAMIIWLLLYWTYSIRSTLNIGVRHLLPTYPFAILLVSGQISRIMKKSKLALWLVVILLVWYVGENIKVFPYYITYFNEVAGGPSGGYNYVVDSNLDWGQDAKRLAQWVKQNRIDKIETDYFGWTDPVYYMGRAYARLWSTKYADAQDFIKNNKSNGWLAVSATFLQGSQGSPDQPSPRNYLWLKSFQPVTIIGNSIFVYHIIKQP